MSRPGITQEETRLVTKSRSERRFRSSEYLEGVFRLAEEMVLDKRGKDELAARYQRARTLAGLTQRQLGDALSYTERTIGSYERGEVDEPLRVVQEWAKVTGVRVEWLMTGEGPEFPIGEKDRLARIEELLVTLLNEIRHLRSEDGGSPQVED